MALVFIVTTSLTILGIVLLVLRRPKGNYSTSTAKQGIFGALYFYTSSCVIELFTVMQLVVQINHWSSPCSQRHEFVEVNTISSSYQSSRPVPDHHYNEAYIVVRGTARRHADKYEVPQDFLPSTSSSSHHYCLCWRLYVTVGMTCAQHCSRQNNIFAM